jgi:hypothetical protein
MPVEKDKAITPDKKQDLIDQVQKQIDDLNKAITQGGLGSGVLEAVKMNRDRLQKILNKLFEKRGVITPKETNSTIQAIENAKSAQLQTDFKKNMKRIGVFLGIAIALGVGYHFYMKSKNK